MKLSSCQPRWLYLAKLACKIDGEINKFQVKYKLNQIRVLSDDCRDKHRGKNDALTPQARKEYISLQALMNKEKVSQVHFLIAMRKKKSSYKNT